jgi:hypothetical protein
MLLQYSTASSYQLLSSDQCYFISTVQVPKFKDSWRHGVLGLISKRVREYLSPVHNEGNLNATLIGDHLLRILLGTN